MALLSPMPDFERGQEWLRKILEIEQYTYTPWFPSYYLANGHLEMHGLSEVFPDESPVIFDFSKEPMPEVCRCGHSRDVHCLGGDEPHCRVYPCLCIDFLPAVDRASMEQAFKALQSTNKPITLEELRAEARVKELEVARQEGRKEVVEFVETFMPSIKQGINGEIWQIKKKEWGIE